MKKLGLMSLVLGTVLFARTETMELTGKYSEQLGNPFKKILNTEKSKKINIFSEDKDVVLKIESNLNNEFGSLNQTHPDSITLKNKSVENVLEDFYIEDYIVSHSKNDAVVLNVQSGTISLNYTDFDNNQVQHLIGVEITLSVVIDGFETKVVLDQTLGKIGEDYDWVISANMNLDTIELRKTTMMIIENQLYSVLRKKDK